MTKKHTWIAVLVLAPGVLILGVMGLFLYVAATAKPIHPNPQDVPSKMQWPRETPRSSFTAGACLSALRFGAPPR